MASSWHAANCGDEYEGDEIAHMQGGSNTANML